MSDAEADTAWTPVATCSDRDEAYRIRDALRLTLPATGGDS